jgi:two-component system KDP operon response regulator KdpE
MSAAASRIVIVESDLNMGMLIEHILKNQGYVTFRVTDGLAAKNLADTQPPPDLVLLNLSLPFLDGNLLLSHIKRTSHGWSNTPVIVLSARSHPQDIARALHSGAAESLGSPIHLDEMLVRVRRHAKSAPTSNSVSHDGSCPDDAAKRRAAGLH